ncbi:MAG: 30S ribosomal protein THX [Flavobacteriales bacterium]|nr:30S ribosomal protein THX [Flavobacteriales bacterium]PIV93881.1 MAG: 30S ribosomal protein THX [Flavobacteriaceae bacterium CG17_big_fil_post_rev_8_21_14_2_50_33_15]PIY09837.1 MAG: 30S ribosomal protein THX [Flavobacteriaceae bacterium CG_4_10_14_3_um_filter_33_47]PJB20184.1 MAG: 30S ribosomal protein THX [Flavobacteriaceae bacterium CG_4_9_14_3_um_filter_33_16]NCP52348.1 30S ribosomal protein THX [Flavobacteriales bacterium]
MGKGDKKTKRGKINRGTFGSRRPRIKKRRSVENKIDIGSKATVK